VLLVRGDVDLAEVQSRLGGRGGRASTQR